MMQTSNVLYCYLKVNNNYAPIFQLVPPAFQALGIQSPGPQKSFSTHLRILLAFVYTMCQCQNKILKNM